MTIITTQMTLYGNHIVSNLNDIHNKILIAPESEANNHICTGNMTQNLVSTVVVQNSDWSYSCVQCDYKTVYLSNLTIHIKSIHEGECHPCPQCEYKGTQSSALKYHTKSVHGGVHYPCDHCGYKATRQIVLHSENDMKSKKKYKWRLGKWLKFRASSFLQFFDWTIFFFAKLHF